MRGKSMRDLLLEKLEKVCSNLKNLEDVGQRYHSPNKSTTELENIGVFKRDFGMKQWDWPQGVGLFGLSLAERYLENNDYQAYIENWYQEQVREGLPCKNINTTAPLISLMEFDFAKDLSEEWMKWIENEASRTNERGLQHDTTGRNKEDRLIKNQEIWIDTLFMTNLFIAKMGEKYNQDLWIDESLYQLLLHTKYLHDKQTNLFFHGWSFEKQNNFGDVLWCRGNGWVTIAIPLTLSTLGERVPMTIKEHLLNYYKNQVDSLLDNYLDRTEYMWRTVLTNPSSYFETSGSSGILAGIYLGIKFGYLDRDEYLSICNQILQRLLTKIDNKGNVIDVSAGTPIMDSEEDYMKIIKAPLAYGQALMLLLLSVALEFH